LLTTLSSEVINDVSDPSQEAYTKFANLLEGYIVFSGTQADATRLWKEILKAVVRSERAFGYSRYTPGCLSEPVLKLRAGFPDSIDRHAYRFFTTNEKRGHPGCACKHLQVPGRSDREPV
jgi:hypothetical protein